MTEPFPETIVRQFELSEKRIIYETKIQVIEENEVTKIGNESLIKMFERQILIKMKV
jgi:putative transposon-encoded protein